MSTDIMVIAVFGDEEHVLAGIQARATGHLLKDSLSEEFINLIKELRAGGSPISPVIAGEPGNKPCPPSDTAPVPSGDSAGLSGREAEVLSFIAKGFSFSEIAKLLEISPHTVTTYVRKIYEKLAVHSRGRAVNEATKMG